MKSDKLSFFIAFEKSPYAGTVRPFINWSKKIGENNIVFFFLLDCGKELVKYIETKVRNAKVIFTSELKEIVHGIEDNDIEILIGDDYYPRLKKLSCIKARSNIATIVYVQVLHGIHSISRVFSYNLLPFKLKIAYKISSLLPFKLLTGRYANHLRDHIIISNSNITENLLHAFYGVNSDAVIYPPVDVDIFYPMAIKEGNKFLLYLGSHAGDTNEKMVGSICDSITNANQELFLLGNKILASKLVNKFKGKKLTYITDVSDKELARIYSKCKLAICPQKWEQFGYVPIESMACGTPVLAFKYMGPAETIIDGKTGWLASTESQFLERLKDITTMHANEYEPANKEIFEFCRKHALENFSIQESSKQLELLLKKI